jgi:hypothetical protein
MYDFVKHWMIKHENHYKILCLNHSNIRTFTKKLAQKLDELFSVIGASEFYVITFLKCDFFGNPLYDGCTIVGVNFEFYSIIIIFRDQKYG